jgi:hypothetical protein
METKKIVGGAVGLALSIAVLYAVVYFSSRAWKSGQK